MVSESAATSIAARMEGKLDFENMGQSPGEGEPEHRRNTGTSKELEGKSKEHDGTPRYGIVPIKLHYIHLVHLIY